MSSNGKRETVILASARTPAGKFEGELKDVRSPDLGAVAIRAAIERSGIDPAKIDEVLMGNVLPAGIGQAPARQASIAAGIPPSICATTVNKICGSGMKTVMLADQAIRVGDGDLYIAGGMENMYLSPYALQGARAGYRLFDKQVVDLAVHDGLWCAFENQHMGASADWVADECGITRERQDEYALASHQKAVAAIESGAFEREIEPVEVKGRKGKVTVVDTDEPPRADTDLEALGRLRPVFTEDGTVTAGNAPGLCHGAAAVVVAGSDWAAANGFKPVARILGHAQAAVEPKRIFLAPIDAMNAVMEQTGHKIEDFDLVELNEAFAAQTLADGDGIPGWDWDKVNIRGGAIALGHPIGASGARILVTLLHALEDTGGKLGMAAACLGGGEAVAMVVELV